MGSFEELSISEIQSRVSQGSLDLYQLAENHIEKIERLNDPIRALRHFEKDAVLQTCREYQKEAAAGRLRGPLHGVLYTAKDSIPVKGMPTSYGTKDTLVPSAAADAALIEKLRAAGAICVGKTNMAEQGKSYYTDNPLFGRTNNPFNTALSPGGSGGGDSAAVACGFAQFGVGADAGGSVRVPANFCGLFGIYPTSGIFSNRGLNHIVHTFGKLFRNSGVIAKNLADLELLFNLLKGFDPQDPISAPGLDYSPPGKRIAFFSALNGVDCDSEIKGALTEAAAKFEQAGYELVDYAPPACGGAYEIFIVLAGQASLILDDLLYAESGRPLIAKDEGAIMKNLRHRIANELPPLTVESLLKVLYLVDKLRNDITATFEKYDFLLCPVSATPPPPYGTSLYKINGRDFQSQQVFQFASMVNLLGVPAIAFPTGLSKAGLPLGLQLIGPRFSELSIISALRSSGYTIGLPANI